MGITTTHDDMVANIVRTFRAATDSQIREGAEWYANAHTFALALAAGHDGNIDTAAGVIAALSPQTPWSRNVTLASRLYAEGALTSGSLGLSLRNAAAVYAGADWRDVFGPNALKIRNFAACIANPTSADAVCVDRHAVAIAADDASVKTVTTAQYRKVAAAYVEAARIVGFSPSQVQAITWVSWRETRAAYSAANRRKVWG